MSRINYYFVFSSAKRRKTKRYSLQEEVKNYTLETVADGIQTRGMTWLPDGTIVSD
jgi:hypothetical protein